MIRLPGSALDASRGEAGAPIDQSLQNLRRTALLCALGPLFTGFCILALYWMTLWFILAMAGLITIYLGVGLCFVGIIVLLQFFHRARRVGLPRKERNRTVIVCLALLLFNFPAAAGMAWLGAAAFEQCIVDVHNASDRPLQHVELAGCGCEAKLGTIAPGATERWRFWTQREGGLALSTDGFATSSEIAGYVSPGVGCHFTVTVGADGEIDVETKYN
ncbi:MAG: hypothetical protein AAF581_10140 [Planctomycetota bacterium]